jgi:hypothetical protein
MSLRRVFLPTEAAILPHEETYCRLGLAGVHPYAVTDYVLQQIVQLSSDVKTQVAANDPQELGHAVVEYLVDTLGVDMSKMDSALYADLCLAVNDLYATLLQLRDLMFCDIRPNEFVSGITQAVFHGADMMVIMEVSSFGEQHACQQSSSTV